MKSALKALTLKESILISVTILSMVYAYQHFYRSPKLAEQRSFDSRVQTLKAQITSNQAMVAQLAARAPASPEVGMAKAMLERFVRSNDRFSSVLMGLVQSSKVGQFSLSRVTSEQSKNTKTYTQTSYSVEAEAPFMAIGDFLEELEDSPLLTEVFSIDIQRIQNEMRRCKAIIRLNSYVVKEGL